MRPKKVFYNSAADAALYGMIREAAGSDVELLLLEREDERERHAKLAEADAAIVAATPLTAEHVAAAGRLRIVHHQGVGYHDTVATAALAARGIPLAITSGGTTVGVAEHTVLLILAALRRLPFADAELRQGRFLTNALRFHSRELAGRNVALVGAGRIGQAVARRMRPFDVTLSYYDPLRLPVETENAFGLSYLPLRELLAGADIVSLHLPVTAQTKQLINAGTLALMRPGAFLINTSRGGLVDETALIEALRSGNLAGAALDVFSPEPPQAGNPLFAMPNVVLTPHIAAGTRDAFLEKMGFIFANLRRFWRGEAVEDLVDLDAATAPPARPAAERSPAPLH